MNKYTTQSIVLNFHEVFVLLHWLTQNALCYLQSFVISFTNIEHLTICLHLLKNK